MEEEEWPEQQLEVFAAAYIQHKDLYTNPVSLHTYSSAIKMKQHEQQSKEFALEQLAKSLGLPKDHSMGQLYRKFRHQLLSYVRSRIRACLLRGEHYTNALAGSLPCIAHLAKTWDLLVVAVREEISCRGSPMRRWAVEALTRELCIAVRNHYIALGAGPKELPSDMLAAASVAVFSDAKHVTRDLWLRICSLRKQQLLKLSLAGDRYDLLRPNERLECIDWQLVDELLMYEPDEAMILTTESLLHWRDLVRALTVLVELLVCARARRPATHVPRARRIPLWQSVHKAYIDTGRTATVVLLQRRWQQLLQMARVATRGRGWPCSAHPLLVMVNASFPQVISKKGVSWQTLVRHDLVATTEDVKSIDTDDKLSLDIDFTQLERCKSTKGVIRYITSKLENEHNIYYEDIVSNREDYISTVIVDSSESDCEKLSSNGCNNLMEVTDSRMSLCDIEEGALGHTIHPNSEVVEKAIKEQDKTRDKTTESQQYFEIDTSKVVDCVSDVLMEVENLKTLNEFEDPLDDLNGIDSYKIMNESKVKAEPNIELINCEEDIASNNLIENSKKEQQLQSIMLDPRLHSMPRIKLKRVDETEAWQKHARLDSSNLDYQSSVQNIKLLEVTYLYDSSTDSEEEKVVKYCYDEKSNNPDLNPVLKRLTKKCWKKNRKLMKLCKPALVRVDRLRENEWPCGGGVGHGAAWPDIDPDMQTAQVKPTNSYNRKMKRVRASRREVLRCAREFRHTTLAAMVERLHRDLEALFALPPSHLHHKLIESHYGSEKEDPKDYNGSYHDWLKCREESASPKPLFPRDAGKTTTGKGVLKKRDQQTIIRKKNLEKDTDVETELDDDLDNMLRCTIIKKPTTCADKPETDVATQPFFVSSNEKLVASNSESTPVITGVCSLAEQDAVLVNDRTSNPTVRQVTNSCRSHPLKETVKKPSQPRVVNGVVNLKDDTVMMAPCTLTIQINPLQKKQDELSQCSKVSLPKQYEHFNDPSNELASLTPVIVRGALTSTITLVPIQHTTTQTFTSAYINPLTMRKQPVTAYPLASHLVTTKMPTNDLQNVVIPSISNTQWMPIAIKSQMSKEAPGQLQATPMTTPKLSTNVAQPMSTCTMTSPMVMTSQMPVTKEPQSVRAPGRLVVSNDFYDVGLHYKVDAEITRKAEKSTVKWAETGHIKPLSALTLNRFLAPKEYIRIHGKFNLTVVKLDSSRALWTLAEEYMILADMNLRSFLPTYWTLGSPNNCSQLVWPESVHENMLVNVKKAQEMDTSSIVVGNVVGNSPILEINEASDLNSDIKDGKVTVVNISDSDSDDGQTQSKRKMTSLLRGKSFAESARMRMNVMEPDTAGSRDVIKQGDRYFKKLTDNPLRYSLMLSAVLSTEECDGLLRDGVALHAWNRRTGALSPLDVTTVVCDQLPARMKGALLVRHVDNLFLKDLAFQFEHLNSGNALVKENQAYIFATPAGMPLVASPDDLTDIKNANLLLYNSRNS